YMISSSSRVSRPKSIATVVVFLSGVAETSSWATLASVITASVVTGGISDTEPTSVVLPAPNPPAMTILVDATDERLLEETFEATERPFQHLVLGRAVPGDRGVDVDQALVGQVADEHLGDAQRQLQLRRDLGHRAHLGAQPVDPLRLRHQVLRGVGLLVRDGDQRLHHQRMAGPGAAAGEGVRTDPRSPASAVTPHGVGFLFILSEPGVDASVRGWPRAARIGAAG